MAKRLIKLVCFDVQATDPKLTKTLDLFKDFSDSLNKAKKISKRCRILSDIAVSGEKEFISKTSIDMLGIFCTFLHLKSGGAIFINNTLLDKEGFEIESLAAEEKENMAGLLKDYTYFLLTKDMLIMKTTKGINEDEIEIYLNWLLKENSKKYTGKSSAFLLKPRLKRKLNPLTVGSINIGTDVKIKDESTISTIVHPIKNTIKDILQAEGIDNLDPDTVIDATVILTVKKPPKKDEAKTRRLLQSLLNAVKSDKTVVKDRKGQIIHENNIKESKEVSVHWLKSNFPDVAELEQEMRAYYTEVAKP